MNTLAMGTQYRPIITSAAEASGGAAPHWWYVTAVWLLLMIVLIPLLSYASDDDNFNCSAYYGLNVCASTFELNDDQITYIEQDKNVFDVKKNKSNTLPGTKLTDDGMNQIQKENAFKNADSFRDYMKTLENPDTTGDSSEFSIKKRILDSTNFGLDCRLVTNSIYELSKSNYYDCALQRYF